MLTEILRMLSTSNSCNVIKYNSNVNMPETTDKMECRGQVEMVKRLFQMVLSDEKLTSKDKETKDKKDEEILQYSDDEAKNLPDTSINDG